MLEASGTFVVSPGEARINLDLDFCRYYRMLALRHYEEDPADYALPRYGAHITVVSKKIHKVSDTSGIMQYSGDTVQFKYDHVIRRGGSKSTTIYAYIECYFAEFIKRKLNIVEPPTFLGLHLSICNNKTALAQNDSTTKQDMQ